MDRKKFGLKPCYGELLSVKMVCAMEKLAHAYALKKSYLCSVADSEQPTEQCFVEFTDKQL